MFIPTPKEMNLSFLWAGMFIFLGWAMARFITASPNLLPVLFASAVAIGIITLVKTDWAMAIIIIAMLLSPELEVAGVPGRAVIIRVEDILLISVFFTWLAKAAINKELGILKRTALNAPIGLYIAICILSTAISVAGGVAYPKKAFFFILKYVEYFMLYFMAVNMIKNRRQLNFFMTLFFLTYFLAAANGWRQIGTGVRVSAPFEGESPEPNTFSGYLILVFSLLLGLAVVSTSRKMQLLWFGLFAFGIPPFLQTLSRSGFLGFFAMAIALVTLAPKRRATIIAVILAAVLLAPFFIPENVKQRVVTTFVGREYPILGKRIQLEPSAAGRVENWRVLLTKLMPKSPLLGFGVGTYFLDSQYITVISEVGLIGFGIFLLLLLTIYRCALFSFRSIKDDEFLRGLTYGFLVGFVALMVHAIGGNTFILIRVMEPFWFMTAVIVSLPAITAAAGEVK